MPIKNFGVYKKIVEGPNAGPVTPQDPSALFTVGDNIYVVMDVSAASKTNDVISVRWTFNEVDITGNLQRTKADCCSATIVKDNTEWQESFLLAPPTTGMGKIDVYYNEQLAYTALFAIIAAQP